MLTACAVAAASGACSSPAASQRSLRALPLPGCPLGDVTSIELEALDDGPSSPSSFAEVTPTAPIELPALPTSTEAFVARGRARDGSVVALGLLLAGPSGSVAGALFRTGSACSLPDATGTIVGVDAFAHASVGVASTGTLLAGGRSADGRGRSDALYIDAARGEVTHVVGMLRRRDSAVVLPLAGGVLIAGGRDGAAVWSDADSIDPRAPTLAFASTPLLLGEPRTDAAGVVLASGDGLLVGGRGAAGALASMERVDAITLQSRPIELHLARARRSPHVARLATGELAVYGGADDSGGAVPDVELFDEGATRSLRTIALAGSLHADAIALPSGALLIARVDDVAALTTLTLVRGDGAVEELGASPSHGKEPSWIAATDGAPMLWDGAWRRFDPWQATLVEAGLPTDLVPADALDPFPLGVGVVGVAKIDAGVLTLLATRYDVRSALVVDPQPLGLGSTAHLVADRRAGVSLSRDGITLPSGARLAITDALFGALSLHLVSTAAPPNIELRTAGGTLVARVGDPSCNYGPSPPRVIDLGRDRLGALTLRLDDVPVPCAPLLATSPAPRVAITLVAGDAGSRPNGLTVSRP